MATRTGLALLASVATLCGVEAAAATRLTVFVRNAVNQAPLDNAVVCVGTATNRAAHGRRTTSNAVAVFDVVPEGNWIITVWKSEFARVERAFSVGAASPANSSQSFALAPGSGADPCGAASPPSTSLKIAGTAIATPAAPTITSMSINGGVDTMSVGDPVYLALNFTGVATEYRVSEVSDQFSEPSAGWRPIVQSTGFGGSIRFPTPTGSFAAPAGTKRVFLQLRDRGRVSNIATDTITMIAKYRAPGIAAIEAAAQNGFQFVGVSRTCAMKRSAHGMEFIVEPAGIPMELLRTYPCTYRLFAGRSLAPGWRLTAFHWRSDYAGGCATLPPSGLAASLILKGEMCNAYLREVELVGPYGSPWQDAFAR